VAAKSSLFGTDGVRGVANVDLTPELAFAVGRAGASVLASSSERHRPSTVGRATRPPGPKGRFLLGHLPEIAGDRQEFYAHCAREYGDCALVWQGRLPIWLLNHPDLIRQVLVTEAHIFQKDWRSLILGRLVGNGLVTSSGEFWLKQRRLMQPAFLRRQVAAYGAEIRRFAGTYDDGVRRAAADAAAEGWMVVSDTAYEGYTDIPRDVMQGYSLMVEEALRQTSAPPSHVFVQGGVGGLAASVCAYLWERYGSARPFFVIVEPEKADCFYRSGVAGRPTPAEGALDTIMAGLACGEVSPLAWRILATGADAFLTIDDDAAG